MNQFVIASITNITTTLLLILFVFIKDPRKLTNRLFALYTLSVALWNFSWLKMVTSSSRIEGLFWARALHIWAILIPITFLHFVVTILDIAKKQKRIILTGYAVAVILLFLASTDQFIPDAVPKFTFKYYTVAGQNYHFFTAFFFICVIYTLYVLFKGYRNSQGLVKTQIKYIFIGYTIGYIGGSTAFFPLFDIPMPRMGLLTISLCLWIITYAIIRYRAFEIDTVIHRTLLWLTTSLWLVLPAYLLFKHVRIWLESLNTLWLTISALGLFYLFLWYYRYFQPKIDHLFRRRKYDYQAILDTIAEKIATTINIENLKEQLLSKICETMYLRNSLLFVLSKDEIRYSLIGRHGYKNEEGRNNSFKTIGCDSKLCKWIIQHKDILEKEQVKINSYYEPIKEEALALFSAEQLEVLVPLALENKINAILGLGKKENLQAFTIKDIRLLKKLGQEVGVTVFNALHYKDLLEKDRLEEELKLGKEIQTALLPKKLPEISGLNFSGLMLPAKEIAGDYFDFIELGSCEKSLAVAIGDVSGKGVASGLIMAAAKATLKGLSQQGLTPKQILSQANNILYEYTAGQKFMTMLYLIYEPKEKTLRYSSAGHERIFLYRHATNSIEAIQLGGFMLGLIPNMGESLEEKRITLNSKDKILLYTDGVTEAQGPSGERFGMERLKESFKAHSQKAPLEMITDIKKDVFTFTATQPQYDDITLVGMEAD